MIFFFLEFVETCYEMIGSGLHIIPDRMTCDGEFVNRKNVQSVPTNPTCCTYLITFHKAHVFPPRICCWFL